MRQADALRAILSQRVPGAQSEGVTHREMELLQIISEMAKLAAEALGPAEVAHIRETKKEQG